MPLALDDLRPLLGLTPTDPALTSFLSSLSPTSTPPDIKTYPDATYHNYYTLGLSLCFLSNHLDSIDIFNPAPSTSSSRKANPYSPPPLPLIIDFAEAEVVLPPRKAGEEATRYPRPQRVEITKDTVGREIVRSFGEPRRKGSGGWVGVWLEWAAGLKGGEVGVMLELQDSKSVNPSEQEKKEGMGGVWDRAASWPWASIKVCRLPPK